MRCGTIKPQKPIHQNFEGLSQGVKQEIKNKNTTTKLSNMKNAFAHLRAKVFAMP